MSNVINRNIDRKPGTKIMKLYLKELLSKTRIVGVIACEADLLMVPAIPDQFDILELRVDSFLDEDLVNALPSIKSPKILTARDASEGGKRPDWGPEQRIGIYEKLMESIDLIDIEVRTAKKLNGVIASARAAGKGVILSSHYFGAAPSAEILYADAESAEELGADIFKVAVHPKTFDGVAELVQFAKEADFAHMQIAPMAMGKFGKVSRLLFGLEDKFPLVYGYLAKPQAPGQFQVSELQSQLLRMRP